MLDRGGKGIRLCVSGVNECSAVGYLKSLYPRVGSAFDETVGALLTGLSTQERPGLRRINLDITPDGALGPTVGPEFHFGRPNRVQERVEERGFLRRLDHLGLGLGEKVEALCRTPSVNPMVFGEGSRIWRVRYLNHVKVPVVESGPLSSKAYLGQTVGGLGTYQLSLPPPGFE